MSEGDLKLRVNRTGKKTVIQWQDANNNHKGRNQSQNTLLIVLFIVWLILLLPTLQEGNIGLFFLTTAALVVVPLSANIFVPEFTYIGREVIITQAEVRGGKHGISVPLKDVSRVEYGAKNDWDQSDKDTRNRTQIRLWYRDKQYIVLSENDWTTGVNHRLHRTIQDEIQAMRKSLQAPSPPTLNAKPAGGDDNFGMPDY